MGHKIWLDSLWSPGFNPENKFFRYKINDILKWILKMTYSCKNKKQLEVKIKKGFSSSKNLKILKIFEIQELFNVLPIQKTCDFKSSIMLDIVAKYENAQESGMLLDLFSIEAIL